MPIDYKRRAEQEEQALEALLEKRRLGIGPAIDARKTQIEQERAQAFGGGSYLEGLGLSPSVAGAGITQGLEVQKKLGTQLEGVLGEQEYGLNRERVNLAYNRALDRAQQAGLDRRASEDFARQVMQDEVRRQHEATLGEKQRQQSIKQQDIANRASQREQELQQYPDPEAEYQQAVIRILSGLPIQLLTYYGLSGGFGGGNAVNPAGGQLTSGTTFSTPINPMTGRRQ